MSALPIDAILPQLSEVLAHAPAVLIEAEPGAGKTTRVPLALLGSPLAAGHEVLVLEPRRMAARLAAAYVAEQLGERVGERVGYQVRFDEAVGPRTRLKFITEALLLRLLSADPRLSQAKVVVLDEFHERHLAGDVALALLRRLQRAERPDLKIVVMSATLDVEPVARYLDAEVLRAKGRQYAVTIEHLARPESRPLAQQVASAARRLLGSTSGHLLAFLPGAREIRRAQESCGALAEGLWVLPLHGEMPLEEQARAVRPSSQRKLILATNVAETSVTIEGVGAVIDSGLARIASHNPWSNLPRLEVRAVSRAAAVQRAGRAGRTAPGTAIRLYTEHDFLTRPAFEVPEVRRADLAETVLLLASFGLSDLLAFDWLEAPPQEATRAAVELLHRLGALARGGGITELGKRMLRLPLHPRQGAILLAATQRGEAKAGAVAAALLAERDLQLERGPARTFGPSDVLARVELFFEAERNHFAADVLRRLGVHSGAARTVQRAVRQLLRSVKLSGMGQTEAGGEEALLFALLAGYPDRVAQRVRAGGATAGDLLLSGGGRARLADSSIVTDAPYLVAVDVEESGSASQRLPLVRLASAIEPEWLIEVGKDDLVESAQVEWNAALERVEAVSRLTYGALVLDESRNTDVPSEAAAPVLTRAALAKGVRFFVDPVALDSLLARLSVLREALPEAELPQLDEAALAAQLTELCQTCRSFAELRAANFLEHLRAKLGASAGLLERETPEQISLLGGRRVKVHYEQGKPPWVESYLQDFFGMSAGPAVAKGRVALTLHLLAPNRRPVQVTRDLAGFWQRHYPELHRALSRRYPKHSWPVDPQHAAAPPVRRR